MVLAVMTLIAGTALTLFLRTEDVRRQHDAWLPKPQRGPHRFRTLLYEQPWIPVVVSLWVAGLLLVAFWRRGSRTAVAEPDAVPAPLRILKGALVVGAIAGLVYTVLSFVGKPAPPTPEVEKRSATVVSTPPAELEILGYLPADSNVVAGLHVADALSQPAGKDFLDRLNLGPVFSLSELEKTAGLRPEDVQDVAAGAKVTDTALKLTVVVRTLRPFDQLKVRAAMKASRPPESFRLASDRVIVLALSRKDLDAVPAEPAAGIDHLPPPVRDFLRGKMSRTAQVWLVGHADRWDRTPAVFLLNTLPKEQQDLVARVQTFGFGLTFDTDLLLDAAAKCPDEAAANHLDVFLGRWDKDGITHAREGVWVNAQARAKLDKLQQSLQRAREGKPRSDGLN